MISPLPVSHSATRHLRACGLCYQCAVRALHAHSAHSGCALRVAGGQQTHVDSPEPPSRRLPSHSLTPPHHYRLQAPTPSRSCLLALSAGASHGLPLMRAHSASRAYTRRAGAAQRACCSRRPAAMHAAREVAASAASSSASTSTSASQLVAGLSAVAPKYKVNRMCGEIGPHSPG